MAIVLDGTTGITTNSETVTSTGIWSVGSTQLYKDSSGNLGIGTTSPVTKLHVATASGAPSSVGIGTRFYETTGNYGVNIGATGTYGWIQGLKGLSTTDGYNDLAINPNGGNVGIGTTSPGNFKLDVNNGGASSVVSRFVGGSSVLLYSTNNGGSNNSYLTMGIDDTGSTVGYSSNGCFISSWNNGTGKTYDLILQQGAAKNIIFATNNTERMRIDSSGNLLVGSTSNYNGGKIEVTGAFVSTAATLSSFNANNAGFDFNASTKEGRFFSTSTNTTGGFMTFTTGQNASYAERMRIDSSGRLSINTTLNNPPSFGAARLMIDSGGIDSLNILAGSAANTINLVKPNGYTNGNMISFNYVAVGGASSTYVGGITISGAATTYATASDYRLKENIKPMVGALDIVSKLKPCTYTWKVDGKNGQGFIAHELQEIIPEATHGTKDEVDADGNPVYQGVDPSKVVATLTAAIQELQAKLKAAGIDGF